MTKDIQEYKGSPSARQPNLYADMNCTIRGEASALHDLLSQHHARIESVNDDGIAAIHVTDTSHHTRTRLISALAALGVRTAIKRDGLNR